MNQSIMAQYSKDYGNSLICVFNDVVKEFSIILKVSYRK